MPLPRLCDFHSEPWMGREWKILYGKRAKVGIERRQDRRRQQDAGRRQDMRKEWDGS